MKANCRVTKAYKSAYPEPWLMRSGDRFSIGKRDDKWEGWIWCTDNQGQSRWIPDVYLRIEGDSAIALCDYDSTELSVEVGDELTILKQAADWAWCRTVNGQEGWVPLENVKRNDP